MNRENNFVGQQNIFVKSNQEAEYIVRASYIVSKKRAGYSKTFSESVFIKECLIELVDTLYPDEKKTFAELYQEEKSKDK